MGTWKISNIKDVTGTANLRYGLYKKPGVTIDRCVVFLNGRTEWIEKYEHIVQELNLPDTCGFLTWDHRGQGASDGKRAYIESYDVYAKDTSKIIKEAIGNIPYVVLAHSMGSLIALYSYLKGELQPLSMVLCGPLFRLPNNPVPRPVARPVSHFLARIALGTLSSGAGQHHKTPFEYNRLTHSIEMFKKIRNCPYMVPGATFGWVASTFLACDYIFDPSQLKKLSVPTLVLFGSKDEVVDARGFVDWVQLANKHAKAPVQMSAIHGARHELLSEIPEYQDLALGQIRQWLASFLERRQAM